MRRLSTAKVAIELAATHERRSSRVDTFIFFFPRPLGNRIFDIPFYLVLDLVKITFPLQRKYEELKLVSDKWETNLLKEHIFISNVPCKIQESFCPKAGRPFVFQSFCHPHYE
jgi:hypothetical protein